MEVCGVFMFFVGFLVSGTPWFPLESVMKVARLFLSSFSGVYLKSLTVIIIISSK